MGIIENFLIVNEDYKSIFDPIQKAIIKFKFQPSILLIKIEISNFKFRHKSVSSKDILFYILEINLDWKKATANIKIPTNAKIKF